MEQLILNPFPLRLLKIERTFLGWNNTKMDIICQDLCEQNDCELIFCCEFGSRSFGYHHEDSDYDVRGIYIKKDRKYYKYMAFTSYKLVDSKNDMIVSKKDNLDIELWDFRKVISLFYTHCNQAPVSWLTLSDTVYFKTDKSDRLMEFFIEKNKESPKRVLSHYNGIAYISLKNYKYTKKIKKYIYSLINILILEWFVQHQTFPESFVKYNNKEWSEMRKREEMCMDVENLESRLKNIKSILNDMEDRQFVFDDTWENIINLIIDSRQE